MRKGGIGGCRKNIRIVERFFTTAINDDQFA